MQQPLGGVWALRLLTLPRRAVSPVGVAKIRSPDIRDDRLSCALFAGLDFRRTEEKGDLDRGGFESIRPVYRILLHVDAEILANRAG